MPIPLSFASIICDDVEALAAFYQTVLDLKPVDDLASEHFRALRAENTVLGFNTTHAYELLNINEPSTPPTPNTFWTFEVDTDSEVDNLTIKAVAAGATCLKEPYRTYYGSWQSVLLDPAGNAFRLNRTAT